MYKAQVQVDQDLKIKPDTLNLIEEKVGNSLECMDRGGIFLDRTLMAQALRSKIDNWKLMKLNKFHIAKDIITRKI